MLYKLEKYEYINEIVFKNTNPINNIVLLSSFHEENITGIILTKIFRYSYDNIDWSSWINLTTSALTAVPINDNTEFYIEIKYTRSNIISASIDSLYLVYISTSDSSAGEEPIDANTLNGEAGSYYLNRANHYGIGDEYVFQNVQDNSFGSWYSTSDSSLSTTVKFRNLNAASNKIILSEINGNIYIDASIQGGNVSDSSITELYNKNISQDASIVRIDASVNYLFQTGVGVTQSYVDGSLSSRDISINNLLIKNNSQDSSIVILRSKDVTIDASITRIDTSISNLYVGKIDNTKFDSSISYLTNWEASQDASIVILRAKDVTIDASIYRIDTSINSLFTKNNNQDTSILNIYTYVDSSLSTRDNSINILSNQNISQDASIIRIDSSINNLYTNVSDINKSYIDGSLSSRDASINILFNQNISQDSSIAYLRSKDSSIDASLYNLGVNISRIDSSINILFLQNSSQDSSIIRIDTSINSIIQKNNYQDTSINDLYTFFLSSYLAIFKVEDYYTYLPISDASITGSLHGITDSSGTYLFRIHDGSSYSGTISKSGYTTSNYSFTVDGSSLLIQTRLINQNPTWTFTGLVVDTSNNIIAAQEVSTNLGSYTTDTSGLITITDISNNFNLSWDVSRSGYVRNNASVLMNYNKYQVINLELSSSTSGTTVSLILFGNHNNKISDASFGINSLVLTTDTSGFASISLDPGTYPYTISKTNYDTINDSVVVNTDNILLQKTLSLTEESYTIQFLPTDSSGTTIYPTIKMDTTIDPSPVNIFADVSAGIHTFTCSSTSFNTEVLYLNVSKDVSIPLVLSNSLSSTSYNLILDFDTSSNGLYFRIPEYYGNWTESSSTNISSYTIRVNDVSHTLPYDVSTYDLVDIQINRTTPGASSILNITGSYNLPSSYTQTTDITDPNAIILLNAMTVKPSPKRANLIQQTIIDLKDSSIWDKLDCFYCFAAHSEAESLLNWIKRAHDCSTVNSPTFTVDYGWQGDGATSYLNSNYDPSSNRDKLDIGNICIGFRAEAGGAIVNLRYNIFATNTANTLGIYQTTSAQQIYLGSAVINGLPHYNVYNKLWAYSWNDSSITSQSTRSLGSNLTTTNTELPPYNLYIFCRNNNGSASNFSTIPISFAFWGGALSNQQHIDLCDIIERYRKSINLLI